MHILLSTADAGAEGLISAGPSKLLALMSTSLKIESYTGVVKELLHV